MTIRTIVPWKAEVFQFSAVALKSHMKPITPWSPLKAIKQHRKFIKSLPHFEYTICGFSIPVMGSYAHMQTRERGFGWRDGLGGEEKTGRIARDKNDGKHAWMRPKFVSQRTMLEEQGTAAPVKCLQCTDRSSLWHTTLIHLLKWPFSLCSLPRPRHMEAGGGSQRHKLLSDNSIWNVSLAKAVLLLLIMRIRQKYQEAFEGVFSLSVMAEMQARKGHKCLEGRVDAIMNKTMWANWFCIGVKLMIQWNIHILLDFRDMIVLTWELQMKRGNLNQMRKCAHVCQLPDVTVSWLSVHWQ